MIESPVAVKDMFLVSGYRSLASDSQRFARSIAVVWTQPHPNLNFIVAIATPQREWVGPAAPDRRTRAA
jgi:hypothetical protein